MTDERTGLQVVEEAPHLSLTEWITRKSDALNVPIEAHMDLTWRCNEGCGHCYLDHSLGGDLSTAEVKGVLDQLADAGTLFLTLSGGEIMLRKDIFEIVAYARSLTFDVKLKTNGILIGEREANRFRDLGVRGVEISVYSHRPEVHDAVTRVPGSFVRSVAALRRLGKRGLNAHMNVCVMKAGVDDIDSLKALAAELGVSVSFDATITPRLDGGRENTALNIDADARVAFYATLTPDSVHREMCASVGPPTEDVLDKHSCGAGFNYCYISPQGDVTPCVDFPLVCGNLRQSRFLDIWTLSPHFQEVRSIRNRDLHTCGSCSQLSSCRRCPGLAYQEGDIRGAAVQDCANMYARTNIPTPLYPPADPGAVRSSGNRRSGQFVPLAALMPANVAPQYSSSAGY